MFSLYLVLAQGHLISCYTKCYLFIFSIFSISCLSFISWLLFSFFFFVPYLIVSYLIDPFIIPIENLSLHSH